MIQLYESRLTSRFFDILLYPYLIYHCSACDDVCKVFYYKVMDLSYHLNVSHEVFPLADQARIGQCIGLSLIHI